MSTEPNKSRGVISWMVHNRVTPNLLMLVLLIGGFFVANRIKQEVFPEFVLDIVSISVPYPGASPAEIEKGIILAIEENIQGLDGIKEYNSTAAEGIAQVSIELTTGAKRQQVFQDIKQEIDNITTFPEDAEEPRVSLVAIKMDVLQITLFGNASEHSLRELAEFTRDKLLQTPGISQVEIVGNRDFEVSVEISQGTLRNYGLTLGDVATRIKEASVELPGGKIKTTGGEILLRIKDRRDWASEFSKIPIITTATGSIVYLEDIAQVREAFEDTDKTTTYNGEPSIALAIARIGKETPIGVAEAARNAMVEIESHYPASIQWATGKDRSLIYQQRLQLLLKNALMGLVLVLVLLGTFLEFRLAFWVTMGIPISFLGGLLFLPVFGVSINMISMFAFIVALGIVVDDAIVAGENIYEYRQKGLPFIEAAIKGAQDVAIPIAFAILTNIVAFAPLLFIPGTMGKIWGVIPTVVITVFVISWVEALLILPSHLAHGNPKKAQGILRVIGHHQRFFSRLLELFISRIYTPSLDFCLHRRGLTLALGIAILILSIGYIKGGRINMILMPRVESNRAVVTATFPLGTPAGEVEKTRQLLEDAIARVAKKHGGKQLVEGVFAKIIENTLSIDAYLSPPGIRPLSTKEVTKQWRNEAGRLVGLQSIIYEADRGGPGRGAALEIELSHRDIEVLDRASADLAAGIETFASSTDVNQGFARGKQQIDFQINAAGKALGLSASTVGRQLRDSFQGAIALKQQRGRNEMRVRVRLPEEERLSEFNIDNMMVHTPKNTFVPLMEIANIERGRAYTTIDRRDGRRIVTVSANVEPIGRVNQISATLKQTILPQLLEKYPGLTYDFEGREAERADSMSSIIAGFLFTLLGIYVLLAIPFRSYTQPLIVMFAIPFGLVGALAGHIIMGYNISIISLMGILALSGVIVNDSLILVDYANKKMAAGDSPLEAIRRAGQRRFRPIMLTTLTTFGGLAPMIFETSRQARFMIPMAISLGFGILFVTAIALWLVPCFFMLIEDGRALSAKIFGPKPKKISSEME
ncbi:efflux RND transporter permease subunit [Desulfotalea psychrophila]|uniref:Related to cobalt-zinc-cadmium resistance protein (CzcA) n=1 Tax=Desulfotalea psychrophila (strain LSv54 / DSM 12343) TaxID=177439 RepID=Q6AJB4_DESPS|nr:efflux RND transporter permease subunit [Desulfotalea psychrophila]CAG37566.1 related to cobalt-zinc-cadmium resistance protein (CzcA) [Desulfotalea psychrophila LSv54]